MTSKTMAISLDEISERIRKNITQSEENKDKVTSVEESALQNVHRDGKTRSALTITFLIGFFALIAGCFVFVLFYNYLAIGWIKDLHSEGLDNQISDIKLLELDKVLAVIIGALGTSLGFIIGYYFKDKNH